MPTIMTSGLALTSTNRSLRLTNVACRRGGRLLFSQLNCDLGPGDAALVTGPNGIGKSSLLRMTAGLLPAFDGEITQKGAIALADESLALDPLDPLAKALGYWAQLDQGADRLDDALRQLGIDHLAPVPVRMLSTGQRKRAVLARTIASGAPIWLLDEPGNGLDRDGVIRLEQLIARHRSTGGIVMLASHFDIALPDARHLVLS